MALEKIEVRNRWTGAVQFTAEIEASDWMTPDLKLGLAVKWARDNRADLSGADLSGAVLSGADLRAFKADFFLALHELPKEVSALIAALKEGRVDGSTYTGSCACLVGTIANAAGKDYSTLPHDSGRPAEQWFAMINRGDKPGDDTGGGYASSVALGWAEEWLASYGEREAA